MTVKKRVLTIVLVVLLIFSSAGKKVCSLILAAFMMLSMALCSPGYGLAEHQPSTDQTSVIAEYHALLEKVTAYSADPEKRRYNDFSGITYDQLLDDEERMNHYQMVHELLWLHHLLASEPPAEGFIELTQEEQKAYRELLDGLERFWGAHETAEISLQSGLPHIDDPIVHVKQTGSNCTFASAAMMLRRHAILRGKTDWSSITEASVMKVANLPGVGMYFNYTYQGVDVRVESYRNFTTQTKKEKLIQRLKDHPEGVVFFSRNGANTNTHAVLLTHYDASTDTFYAADPAGGRPRNVIPLNQAYVLGSTQQENISHLIQIWHANPPAPKPAPPPAPEPEPQPQPIVVENRSEYQRMGVFLNVPRDKTWTIQLNRNLDINSVSDATIFVTDENNRQHPMQSRAPLYYLFGRTSSIVIEPGIPYLKGMGYTLWIKDLVSEEGERLSGKYLIDFTVAP